MGVLCCFDIFFFFKDKKNIFEFLDFLDFFLFFLFVLKLLGLLLSVTDVNTEHKQLLKECKNSVKSSGGRPKPSAGARIKPCSGLYLLVFLHNVIDIELAIDIETVIGRGK